MDPRYEVSNFGRVRRATRGKGTHIGRVLAQHPGGRRKKYLRVALGDWRIRPYVHRLVTEAFLGPPPTPAHEVNHKDGDGRNNVPTNLEWVTASENLRHSYQVCGRVFRAPKGEQQWNHRLTEANVLEIRRLHASGFTNQRKLGEMFGVGQVTIHWVVRRVTWKHLP